MTNFGIKGFIVFSILLFFSNMAYGLNNKNNENEYKDKKDRYSLMLPKGWMAIEEDNNIYFEYESKEFYASFYIDGYPVEKGQDVTAQEISSGVKDYDYNEDGWEVHNKIIDKIQTHIDGVSAVLVHQKAELKENIEGKIFSDITIVDEYYFVKNNNVYIISFSVNEKAYEKIKADFQYILKTFKAGNKSFEIKEIPEPVLTPLPEK